jgi:hypothetical protein
MQEKGTSFLIVEEYFAREDERFVEALRAAGGGGKAKRLAAFADRWKTDPRPWAREQVFKYLALPLNAEEHQPVVKRLYKEMEKRGDDAVVGALLVAFDTLVRRVRRTRWTWDYESRAAVEVEELKTPRDVLPKGQERTAVNPKTMEPVAVVGRKPRPGAKLFSYRTRYYLRRRAWRYFRKIGATAVGADGRINEVHGARYVKAVAGVLSRYEDEDLQAGENILDSWCLMQIAFRASPALEFTPHHVRLVDGHGLGELAAAPRFLALWKARAGGEALLELLKAPARLVRVWARQLLEREHGAFLRELAPAQLYGLLESADEEVQQFAAGVLKNLAGLETLPLAEWLRLLETKNELALEILVEALREKVSPQRFSLEQLVDLATRRPAAVARLGLDFLETRPFNAPAELDLAARLSQAKSPAVAGDVARFGLRLVAGGGAGAGIYNIDRVCAFFDALQKEVRAAAWDIMKPGVPAWEDVALWARLMESPFDDVRLRLVDLLETRKNVPRPPVGFEGATASALTAVWTAVLLGVHRGGRQKVRALHQVSRALLAHAEHAGTLLPIAAVAIRSVRPAEARVGLAAVVGVLERRPELAEAVARVLPEMLVLPTLETTA